VAATASTVDRPGCRRCPRVARNARNARNAKNVRYVTGGTASLAAWRSSWPGPDHRRVGAVIGRASPGGREARLNHERSGDMLIRAQAVTLCARPRWGASSARVDGSEMVL
jgi:hypothetical protein